MQDREIICREIERRRDKNLETNNPLFAAMADEDNEILSFIDSMEEESKPKYKVGDTVYYYSFGKIESMVVENIVDNSDGNPMYEDVEGNGVFENELVEEPKKCMYSKDNYTDEDRKVLCDGCEEECEYNEEPVSEELEEAMQHNVPDNIGIDDLLYWRNGFITGANWQKENLWKPADGDDLPEYNREVIALLDNGKVVFAHRPPEYWDGKNIITGKVTRNYPKTYDKGGWNIPNVKWWLDVYKLPNVED